VGVLDDGGKEAGLHAATPGETARAAMDDDRVGHMTDQRCPLCSAEVAPNPRYPDHLCRDCAVRTVDAAGRAVTLQNTAMSGGVAAFFADGTRAVDVERDHVVFVDGVRCRAEEAHFGGIVVRPEPAPSGP
jgi:hypothetical protein